MKAKQCPVCNARLIEDASEELIEREDGTFLMDGFLAYVCENNCGYVKRLEEIEEPNVFSFGTTELTQDAFLCWLFEHVRVGKDNIVATIANQLLEKTFESFAELKGSILIEERYRLTEIEQQINHIDVLLTFESEEVPEKLYIIIEDKINSGESKKNQLLSYKKSLRKKDPASMIIPILFKTGYVSEKQKQNEKAKGIVFIGYEEIYDIFSKYEFNRGDSVILTSWWEHFLDTCYWPINRALHLEVDEDQTLRELNQIFKRGGYPEEIFFQKLMNDLFAELEGFRMQSFSYQGRGHIDWHFQIRKPAWKDEENQFEINLYFIWDTRNFSFVIKTAPIPYKSKNKLTEVEKTKYLSTQSKIVTKLKESLINDHDWKFRKNYL